LEIDIDAGQVIPIGAARFDASQLLGCLMQLNVNFGPRSYHFKI
jgi:hypothetical protein